MRATSPSGQPSRRASSSPPCGPAAVTSVPHSSTQIVERVDGAREPFDAGGTTRSPRSRRRRSPARRCTSSATPTSAMREQEVAHHAEPRQLDLHRDAAEDRLGRRTARAASTPGGSGRRGAGRRRYAPINSSAIGMPIAPEKMRLSCSIAAWCVDTSTTLVALHAGQSAQPRPEFVSRTAAPLTMIATSSTTFTSASRRKAAEDGRRTGIAQSVRR